MQIFTTCSSGEQEQRQQQQEQQQQQQQQQHRLQREQAQLNLQVRLCTDAEVAFTSKGRRVPCASQDLPHGVSPTLVAANSDVNNILSH